MSGLKLSDEKIADTILRLIKALPQGQTLKLTIRHEDDAKTVRWWHTPIDKQHVKTED